MRTIARLTLVLLAAYSFLAAQDTDIRGIYLYTNDVSQIANGTVNALNSALGVTGVDGIAIVIGWDAIEPSMGQFQWTLLDQWINTAISKGKKIDLVVPAGDSTPAWLFQPAPTGGGATALTFTVSPHAGATGQCQSTTIAAPWDPAFLAQWDAMLAAVSVHLKNAGTYGAVTLIRITGINRTSEEMRLPAETAQSTGLACVTNALSTWQQAGYKPSLLLHGWDGITSSFQKSFPDKPFAVSIIPANPFPAIAEDGSLIKGTPPDMNLPLITLGAQKWPGRFIVQNDFLMPGEQAAPAVSGYAAALGTMAAFQTNEYLGSTGAGAACSEPVTNPTPCTAATFLAMLETGIYPLGQSNPLRSEYIEVFHGNTTAFPASIQQAHLELTCDYTLSSGGQAFGPAFATGTIFIAAPPGCPWSVSPSLPAWVTITSPTSGTGNGTITYQVLPNSTDNNDRTGTFTVAGVTFTVEQWSFVSGLSLMGSMPHLAAEGAWNTTFTFVNKGASPVTARMNLYAPTGAALTLPVSLPQQPLLTGPLLGSTIEQTITPNASLVMQAAGPANVPYLEGSAQLFATGAANAVDGFAIFHYNPSSQEAVVPLETRNASCYILPFDNTNGVLTGVALDNVSGASPALPVNIPVVIRDLSGNAIFTGPLTAGPIGLNGLGHTSFVLSQQFPFTAGMRGTIEFDTPPGGQISALGIRYTPPGTLTTIPALANVGTGGGLMAHLAAGNGWQTTFVLVNTGTTAGQAHLKFFSDSGNPLSLPVSLVGNPPNTASTFDVNVAAGGSIYAQSVGVPGTLLTGSAQLTVTGNIGGFVIFRYNPNGQEAVVPLENRGAGAYLIAYDDTANTATGIAIANASAVPVSIPVTLRDDQGNVLGTSSIALNGNGHSSFILPALFSQSATNRGTVEFDTPAGATIGVLGIRSPPALTFTTLPALAK